MESKERDGNLVRFGPFEVDLEEKRLRKHGHRIKLQGQPFMVLLRLLEDPGHLVSRDELRNELWPEDTFVDFDHSLNEAVNKLRTALGDSASTPRFVETVPRHGYRFIAPVQADRTPQETPVRPATPGRRLWLAAIAAVVIVAGLAAALVLRSEQMRPDVPIQVRSLAVLPLVNLSGDPDQEYFADGMTEELISDLSMLQELRVISRTSAMRYKNSSKSLPEIASELGVDALIEGSVRLGGDKVRITVQLVYAPTDETVWSRNFERMEEDALALQTDVAMAIVDEIRIELLPRVQARLTAVSPVALEALQAYRKGRHHWNQRTEEGFRRAIHEFETAVRLEPSYARAYAGLADTYILLAVYNVLPHREAIAEAKQAARKALELDPDLADAHASLGAVHTLFDWDWEAAERELLRATELNPGYVGAYQYYGVFLAAMGRSSEAVAQFERALDLDPLNLSVSETLGWALFTARRFDAAVAQFQETLELDADFGQALRYLGLTHLKRGELDEALARLERAREVLADVPEITSDLAVVYSRAGREDDAEALLEKLMTDGEYAYVSPYLLASYYTGVGRLEQALEWLEKAYAARSANLIFLAVDPLFDDLRSEPRFEALLARIGISDVVTPRTSGSGSR